MEDRYMSDLKEMFPREYKTYCLLRDHPPEGCLSFRPEYLGEDGFANWLKNLFETQEEADHREGWS